MKSKKLRTAAKKRRKTLNQPTLKGIKRKKYIKGK